MASTVIRPISSSSIHRICSGQVVLDVATGIKELVENSLDSGATNIEVRLKEYGSELIEVIDNGPGISPDNYESVALKYHTSKISDMTDLTSLTSFGFRGEALSSLCALAELSIVTRLADQSTATRLEYDSSGNLKSNQVCARPVGTTVVLKNIFSSMPVRHAELKRNLKREYGKVITLIKAYALICQGVRIRCINQAKNTARTPVLNTKGAGTTLRDNVVNVFGSEAVESMLPVELDLTTGRPVEVAGAPAAGGGVAESTGPSKDAALTVVGYVSKATAGAGRGSGDRQFLFLNGRPVDLPKITKVLNEVYHTFNVSQMPMAVLNFKLPTDSYDVNVTPDKRQVLMHNEVSLLAAFKEALTTVYEPSRNTYQLQDVTAQGKLAKGKRKRPVADSDSEGESEEEEEEGEEEQTESDDEELNGNSAPHVSKGPAGRESGAAFGVPSALTTSASGITESAAKKPRADSLFAPFSGQTGGDGGAAAAFGGFGFKSKASGSGPGKVGHGAAVGQSGSRGRRSGQGQVTMDQFVAVEERGRRGDDTLMDDAPGAVDAEEQSGHEGSKHEPQAASGGTLTAEDHAPPGALDVSANHTPAGVGTVEEEGTPGGLGPAEDHGAGGTISVEEHSPPERSLSADTACEAAGVSQEQSLAEKDPVVVEDYRSDGQNGSSGGDADLRLTTARGSDAPIVASWAAGPEGEGTAVDAAAEDMEEGATHPEHGQVRYEDVLAAEHPQADLAGIAQADEDREGEEEVEVQFDIEELRVRRAQRRAKKQQQQQQQASAALNPGKGAAARPLKSKPLRFKAASLQASASQDSGKEAQAESELEHVFSKSSFREMRVVGQFNLGFILAVFQRNLFILDQHACDEKFNFERLQRTTTLNKQPLICPQPLDLTAAEELTVIEHMETFRQSGFNFVVEEAEDGDGVEDDDDVAYVASRAQSRVKLTAVPFSKHIVFGGEDVKELIALIDSGAPTAPTAHSNTSGSDDSGSRRVSSSTIASLDGESIARPSKVRAMLASRACRCSIMIGRHLDKSHMARVIANLVDLKSPWNCPHGRPTMRHVADLSKVV